MLENWLMDELSEKESGDFIFRQNGVHRIGTSGLDSF